MAANQVIGVLRALLTADTSEYDKAMKAAGASTEKVAESIEKSLGPRLSTVTGLVKNFLGGADIRRAEEYAMAIEKVGGAANLVAADQKAANRVISEAIEHFRILGTEVPPNIAKVKTELDQVAAATGKIDALGQASDFFMGKWAALASAVSVGNLLEGAISGLVNLGKAAIADAGHLVDLSTKTGLSTEALQLYGEVAAETGSSVDAVADAVFTLGVKMSEGTKEAQAALTDLGLSYDAIKAMRPEDQFEAVAKALQGVATEQERNRLGVALMGKGYKEVAAAIVEGLDSIKDKTIIVSDAQIRAIDAAADAWDRFWENTKKQTLAGMGSLVLMWQEGGKSIEGQIGRLSWLANGLALNLPGMLTAQAQLLKDVKAPAGPAGPAASFGDMEAWARAASEAVRPLTDDLKRLQAAVKALTAEEKKQIEAGIAIGLSSEKIAAKTGVAAEVIDKYKESVQAATKAAKDEAEEQKKREKLAVDQMWARDAAEVAEYEKRIKSVTAANEALNNVLAKRVNLSKLPGGLDMEKFGDSAGYINFKPGGKSWFDQAGKDAIGPDKVVPYAESAAFKFGSKFSSTLAGALQGGGNISGSIGGMVGDSVASGATKALSKSLTGTIGKTILGAIPIVGPILGAVGGQLIGKLFHNEGKDANKLRDSLKAQFGDAGGAALQDLVGKYKESTAVQSAYADFLAAKTTESVQKSFDALKSAMGSAVTDADAKAAKLAEALGKIGAASAGIVGGFAAKLAPAATAIEALKRKQEDLAASGDVAGAGEIAIQVLEKTKQAAIGNQTEFDRLGRITLASFNAFIGQGKSAIEAVQAVGPAIDSLKTSAETFGFAGSAAYDQLSRWRTLTSDNAPLLDQVSGLNDLLSALSSLGAVDAATFADIQAQGVSAFESLTAAGFTSSEAATQLAPLLQTILDMHEKTGLAIDDETQAVIDQAQADGALKKKQISDQQVMIEGFSALIKAVGGEVPAAFTKMADSSGKTAEKIAKDAKKAAGDVTGAFDGISVTVPVNYAYPGGDMSVVDPSVVGQYAEGGIATRPTLGVFGEAGPEALVPLDRLNVGGPKTIVLETDGRAWARVHAPYVAGEVQRLQLTR